MALFEMQNNLSHPDDAQDEKPMEEEEETLGVFYRAKCGNHKRFRSRLDDPQNVNHHSGTDGCFVPEDIARSLSSDEDQEEEDEIVGLQLPQSIADVDPSHLRCNCFDPNCKLRRYFRYQSKQQAKSKESGENAGSADINTTTMNKAYQRLHESNPNVKEARDILVSRAGGADAVNTVYDCCLNLYKREPQMLSATASDDGDTVLMQLCSRSTDSTRLLYGQINAFIRLYIENDPKLLFVRNAQGTNALELAGLTNKAEVALYLALLYGAYGRDVNEANAQGHTVLHLLARKGDDCADTLERLLDLRRSDSGKSTRLLRLDVVNEGRKTPLDVALACKDIFSTGRERTIYTRVIQSFHDVIEQDAREIMSPDNTATSSSQLSFRNF